MASSDIHRELHDLFNRRDFEALRRRIRADAVYVDHPRAISVKGPEEFVSWLQGWTTAMSDARCDDARYLDAGDSSVACFVGRGRNDGQLGPFPASNQQLAFDLCEILTYDDGGMVTGGELYYDQATILTQMGVALPIEA